MGSICRSYIVCRRASGQTVIPEAGISPNMEKNWHIFEGIDLLDGNGCQGRNCFHIENVVGKRYN